MSFEFLILLALFTLLPIIEQAWRKHREAREQARRRALGLPPVPPPVPGPLPIPGPPPIPRRVPPGHAPLPANRDAFDDDDDVPVMVRPTPRPRPRAIPPLLVRSPVVPRVAAQRRDVEPLTRRQRARIRGVARDRGAVRRGIIAMTVFGPCRANEPYDGPAVGRSTARQ